MKKYLIFAALLVCGCTDDSEYYSQAAPAVPPKDSTQVASPAVEVTTFNGQQVVIVPGAVLWDKAQSAPKKVVITIIVNPDNSIKWSVNTNGTTK